ncbi:SDR family NAD(P)-dependent oxidoreductase [Sorangium sp. So ce117]|uniref:SDR family NAD(P)-dependent oxidoreductase n=1 Tax=Sorangium sp. So ce117 TaxID=3133277 RepID=UPI003F63B74D
MTRHPFENRNALITGASTGIGAEFARQLAAQRCHLILVARSRDKLEALAAELRAAHGVRVEVIADDLTSEGAIGRVHAEVARRGVTVNLLVNNAGFATHGRFEETPIARQLEEITLNVSALVAMTHAFLPDLVRTRGAVLNVASTAAFYPIASMAVYGATKAFVLSFSEALWAELGERGVKVVALCPGATETPFFEIAGEAAAVGAKAKASDVVRLGLSALSTGRTHAIHGLGNYILANLARFVPRAMAARLTADVMRKNQVRALPARTARARP